MLASLLCEAEVRFIFSQENPGMVTLESAVTVMTASPKDATATPVHGAEAMTASLAAAMVTLGNGVTLMTA